MGFLETVGQIMVKSSKPKGHRDMQDGRGLQSIQNELWEWKARLGWFSLVKVLSSKANGLTSVLRTHTVEKRTDSHKS